MNSPFHVLYDKISQGFVGNEDLNIEINMYTKPNKGKPWKFPPQGDVIIATWSLF